MDVSLGFAVYATTSGAVDVPGIFSRDFFSSDPGGAVSIQSTAPMFKCETSTVTGVGEGDTLTVDSVGYVVVEKRPDGTGITEIRLQLV